MVAIIIKICILSCSVTLLSMTCAKKVLRKTMLVNASLFFYPFLSLSLSICQHTISLISHAHIYFIRCGFDASTRALFSWSFAFASVKHHFFSISKRCLSLVFFLSFSSMSIL